MSLPLMISSNDQRFRRSKFGIDAGLGISGTIQNVHRAVDRTHLFISCLELLHAMLVPVYPIPSLEEIRGKRKACCYAVLINTVITPCCSLETHGTYHICHVRWLIPPLPTDYRLQNKSHSTLVRWSFVTPSHCTFYCCDPGWSVFNNVSRDTFLRKQHMG